MVVHVSSNEEFLCSVGMNKCCVDSTKDDLVEKKDNKNDKLNKTYGHI